MKYRKHREWINECKNTVIRFGREVYFATFRRDMDMTPYEATMSIVRGKTDPEWRVWKMPEGWECELSSIKEYG